MKSILSIIFVTVCLNVLAQKFVLKDSLITNNKTVNTIDTDLNNSLYLISDTKIEKIFQSNKNKIVDLKNVITTVDTGNPLRTYIYSNFNCIKSG